MHGMFIIEFHKYCKMNEKNYRYVPYYFDNKWNFIRFYVFFIGVMFCYQFSAIGREQSLQNWHFNMAVLHRYKDQPLP